MMAPALRMAGLMLLALLIQATTARWFCKDGSQDCDCSNHPSNPFSDCSPLQESVTLCYPDRLPNKKPVFEPALEVFTPAFELACSAASQQQEHDGLALHRTYHYPLNDDDSRYDEHSIFVGFLWYNGISGSKCTLDSTTSPGFPLAQSECELALQMLIGYNQRCSRRGGYGTNWCWGFYVDANPRKNEMWRRLYRDVSQIARDTMVERSEETRAVQLGKDLDVIEGWSSEGMGAQDWEVRIEAVNAAVRKYWKPALKSKVGGNLTAGVEQGE